MSPRPLPPLVEIRILTVGYAGARGARAQERRTKGQALDRANMLARMGRTGTSFAELVRSYSDRKGAADDLGLIRFKPARPPSTLDPAVAGACLRTEVGEISEPFEVPEGYAVVERRPDPDTGPTTVAARHILISYVGAPQALSGVTRSEVEARALADQVAARAQRGEDWAGLAAQYTDEPGSKETGGDLGRFGHGQMVPSFEKAAFALEVGAVSQVVSSPFGFHIIQRYE